MLKFFQVLMGGALLSTVALAHKMPAKRLLVLFTLFAVLALAASAAPVTYFVSGTYNDGGTFSGTFTYDATTNRYSNVNITTTPGTVRLTGATYQFVCGQDVPTCNGVSPSTLGYLNLTTTAADQTGLPAMSLFFSSPLDGSDVVDRALFSLEANCSNATCSAPAGPTRSTATGLLVAQLFQISYAANMNIGDSVVNLTSAGSMGGFDPAGDICANVYVFAEDQQLIACCTCPLTPNHLKTLSVQKDLISNTLTPGVPIGVTIALVASTGTCNPSTVTPPSLASGLRAWGTTLHAAPGGGFAVTENVFAPAALSASELAKLTSYCGFIQANGSGFGICGSCRQGAAGAAKQ